MGKVTYGIVCTVLDDNGKVLILKRAPNKKLLAKKWFVIGAYPLRADDDFRKIAEREMIDELGEEGKIIKEGRPFSEKVGGGLVKIKPFLAVLKSQKVKLNEEHTEYRWVERSELRNFDLADGTVEMIFSLLQDDKR